MHRSSPTPSTSRARCSCHWHACGSINTARQLACEGELPYACADAAWPASSLVLNGARRLFALCADRPCRLPWPGQMSGQCPLRLCGLRKQSVFTAGSATRGDGCSPRLVVWLHGFFRVSTWRKTRVACVLGISCVTANDWLELCTDSSRSDCMVAAPLYRC